ncbi:MAG TPA: glycosyltransferase family 39 protein [Candidatus Peribacteraceae bacterium]|nr:glycosyltransferase family 39 protein [Candidatus Peribacteraceae bacterium]
MTARMASRHSLAAWIWALVIIGILLRVFYTAITPYGTRAHDVGSHIDYIQYVADHWSLPDPHAESEFYHPPLYYFLSAVLLHVETALGLNHDQALVGIQWFACLLSVITLLIVFWTGRLLFPDKKDEPSLLLYTAFVAVLPSFIFFAARINNDVLYQVFAFLSVALAIAFWLKGKTMYWYLTSVALGLGLLSKGNVLLLVPLSWLLLMLHKKYSWTDKMMHLAASALILVALAGWFYVPRYIQEHQSRVALVGNVNILTNFVENTPAAYLTFNPVGMVMHPYNDPFDDAARRQYFWEYLARSALYGEFNFGVNDLLLARMMVASFLLILLLGAYSIWTDRKLWYRNLPVWSLLIFLLIGHAIFRYVFPYSSSQDFRYSILLIIPIAYYMARGWSEEQGTMQMTRTILPSYFVICCSVFLLSLASNG